MRLFGNVAPHQAARIAQIDRAFRPAEPGGDPLDAGIGLAAETPVQHLDPRIGIMRAGQGAERQRHGLMQHPFPPVIAFRTQSIHGRRAKASTHGPPRKFGTGQRCRRFRHAITDARVMHVLRPFHRIRAAGAAGCLAALLAAACGPAAAQAGGGDANPSQQVAHPGAPTQALAGVAPKVEHMLPDWGGWRHTLEDKGIFLLLDATSEFAGNVSGGVRRGATFANQVGLEFDIDWQRLAGVTGFSTHAIVVNRSGNSTSHLFGDNLLPVQEIYGAGGDVAVHLVR